MGNGFIVTTNKRMHSPPTAGVEANCAASTAVPTVLKIADRVTHARSMVFALLLLSWLVSEKKAMVSPMHRWVARYGRQCGTTRYGFKGENELHGPWSVGRENKNPYCATSTPVSDADPPFEMLFIARGTLLTQRQENPLRVQVHEPTNIFSLFFSWAQGA
jgi:hypothetical protein